MHSQRWILCFIVQSKVSNPLLVSKGRGGLRKIPRAYCPQGRRVLTGLGRGPGSCILGIVLFVWRRRTGIWGSAFLFLLGDGIISTTVLSTLISGGVCGWAVNTSNSGSGGQGFKPRPSRCFLRQGNLLHFVSLHPGAWMGTGDILLGDNPLMD